MGRINTPRLEDRENREEKNFARDFNKFLIECLDMHSVSESDDEFCWCVIKWIEILNNLSSTSDNLWNSYKFLHFNARLFEPFWENINKEKNIKILNEILEMDLKPNLRKRLICTIWNNIVMLERRKLRLKNEDISRETKDIKKDINQELNDLNQKVEILKNALYKLWKVDVLDGFEKKYLNREVEINTEDSSTKKIIFPFEYYDETRRVKGFDVIETILKEENDSWLRFLSITKKDLWEFDRLEDRIYLVQIWDENINFIPLLFWNVYNKKYEFMLPEEIDFKRDKKYAIYYKNGHRWKIETIEFLKSIPDELWEALSGWEDEDDE